jgi:hypothetical protein
MVGKASGRKVNLQGTFVESPLVWAVAARTDRDGVTSIPELLGDHMYFSVSSFSQHRMFLSWSDLLSATHMRYFYHYCQLFKDECTV